MKMTSNDKTADLEGMKKKLADDGLDPQCCDEEKIRHLWDLYIKSEARLEASLQNLSELRAHQTEEMREVDNYVEHIRSLSDEREALTLEFEAENEQLKIHVEQLKEELASYHKEEIAEMLLQQGLDDIANGTTGEQIAYLLVERARLMDELEAEQGGNLIDTPEGAMTGQQIYSLLETERRDFESELAQQRDSLREVKDTLEQGHEEDLAAMMEENQKVQNLLSESRYKIEMLEDQVEALKENLDESTSKHEESQAVAKNSDSEDKTIKNLEEKHSREVRRLEEQVEELTADNKTLMDNIQTLTIDLQEVKTASSKAQLAWERTEQRLENEINLHLLDIKKLQSSSEKLTAEKKAAERRADFNEREAEDLREQDRELRNKMRALESGKDTSGVLKTEIDRLREDKHHLQEEASSIKASLREEKDRMFELDLKFKRMESDLEGAKEELELQENRDKTKIENLEKRIKSLEADLDNTELELKNLRHKDEQEETALGLAESELRDVRHQLQAQTREKQHLEEQLRTCQGETQALKTQIDRLGDEKNDEQQGREEEKRQLAHKLMEAEFSIKDLTEKLKREKHSREESESAHESRLTQVYQDLDELRGENARVNLELTTVREELDGYKSQAAVDKAKAEKIIQSLRDDLIGAQRGVKSEKDSLAARLEQIYAENRELRSKYSRKEEELSSHRRNIEKAQCTEDLLEVKVQSEQRLRSDLQQRNLLLEEETKKNQEKLKETFEKVAILENKNEKLEAELDRKTNQSRESEQRHSQREIEQNTQIRISQSRTEAAERKLYELQSDLEEALSRLQTAELQVRETTQTRIKLENKETEIQELRTQLHQEQIQRSAVSHGSDDLQHQLSSQRDRERDLQKRNNELQHMLLDLEGNLQNMKDQTKNNMETRLMAEQSKRQMTDQAGQMQKDIEALQMELYSASEKYDQQIKKYAERKIRTQNKLHKARELFNTEKVKLRSEVDRLSGELTLATARLEAERQTREHIEQGQQKLVHDNRELMTRLSECEEAIRDQHRKASMLQVRTKFLEDENVTLQQRVDTLARQKQNLDRLVKEYQNERQREDMRLKMSANANALLSPRTFTMTTSGLGDSLVGMTTNGLGNSMMTSSVTKDDQDSYNRHQSLDAIISPRVRSPVAMDNWRLSQTLPIPELSSEEVENDIEDLGDTLPPPINHSTFPGHIAHAVNHDDQNHSDGHDGDHDNQGRHDNNQEVHDNQKALFHRNINGASWISRQLDFSAENDHEGYQVSRGHSVQTTHTASSVITGTTHRDSNVITNTTSQQDNETVNRNSVEYMPSGGELQTFDEQEELDQVHSGADDNSFDDSEEIEDLFSNDSVIEL